MELWHEEKFRHAHDGSELLKLAIFRTVLTTEKLNIWFAATEIYFEDCHPRKVLKISNYKISTFRWD